MSCPLRVELNSAIKFDKSAVEAQCLNETFKLSSAKQSSSTSFSVLHDPDRKATQTSCLCLAKQHSYIIFNAFW